MGYTVGNIYDLEVHAVMECIIRNMRNAIRNGNRGEATAHIKRTGIKGGNTVWYDIIAADSLRCFEQDRFILVKQHIAFVVAIERVLLCYDETG